MKDAIPHVMSDAGRDAGEHNDCSVRALAHCLNVPYGVAHEKLAAIGRRDGHGLKFKAFSRALADLGLEQCPQMACMTLASALPQMQSGRFLCRVSKHFFTVIDGAVYDTWQQKPGRRLHMVYQPITP